MNILFIVPYVPDLVRVRPYNLIRSLTNKGHRITLLTLWSRDQELASLEQLKPLCQEICTLPLPAWRSLLNCFYALPTKNPLQAAYCWQPEMAQKINMLFANSNGRPLFDIVHVEHLRGVKYGLSIKFIGEKFPPAEHKVPPIVWDSVDSISLLFRQASSKSQKWLSRFVTRFELNRTEQYEGWLVNQFNRTLVTSYIDKEAFVCSPLFHSDPELITVLPNGVDLDYFQPNLDKTRDPATLVISGKMSYHANISMVKYFIDNILPRIWEKRPEVRLCIVGKDPPEDILALGRHPQITVTGTVEDIRPYLQRATIAVAPIQYGAGIQNKVLEAMACATPVVATKQAVSALRIQTGRDVLIAQEPEEFAQAILQLLEDREARSQIGLNGRRYVEEYHQWSKIATQLEGVYDEVVIEHK